MPRLTLTCLLSSLLCLAVACDDKKAADTAPSPSAEPKPVAEPAAEAAATPVAAAAEPAAKPTEPAAKPTEPTPAPAQAASGAAASGEGAPVDPASLDGHYAFGWSGGKTKKCQKVDARMVKKLSGKEASCRRGDPGGAFAEGAGDWSECEVGKAKWVVFATRAICQEQLETMEANAP